MTENKLTIREGGFYRTRSGRRVGPLFANNRNDHWPWLNRAKGDDPDMAWRADGRGCTFNPIAHENPGLDLIAEWTYAAPAPAEGTLRELDVKPGDVVSTDGIMFRVDAVDLSKEEPFTLTSIRFGDKETWEGTDDDWRIVSRAPAATDDATIQRVMDASAPAMDHDPVSHPAHYNSHPSGVECLTITRWMGFNLGNAMKYIWRADMKGAAIEDLRKAAFYIADEIAKREAGTIDPASYRVEARG